MSNNKKFLKRTVAAFLAAVNIFNFAGGSSKAYYIDCTPYCYGISDFSVINSDIINNILKIADLKIEWNSIKTMKTNQEIQSGLSLIQKIESDNNGIYVYNLKLENKDFKFVYFDFKNASICKEKFNEYLEKVNKVYESEENKKNGFVVFDRPGLWPIGSNTKVSSKMFYDELSKNGNIFVSKDVFLNQNFCKLIEEIKNLQEELETEKAKVQKKEKEVEEANQKAEKKENNLNAAKEKNEKLEKENDKLKKENDKIAIYSYKKKVLNGLVKLLEQKSQENLDGTADNLKKVQDDINFQDAKFNLISDIYYDDKFLGDVELKYKDKKGNEKVFSINGLIDDLVELNLIEKENKIKKLKPIAIKEITKEEKQKEVLNVEAYNKKLQGYIEALQGIIKAINSIPGSGKLNDRIKELKNNINELKNNINECKSEIKVILRTLDQKENSGDDLKTQFENINKGIDGLKSAKETVEANLQTEKGKYTEAVNEKNNAIKNLETANNAKTKAENNLKAANRRANIFKIVAGCGWVGTLLGLGYILKNELSNKYSTSHKKVLELKDKMSSK